MHSSNHQPAFYPPRINPPQPGLSTEGVSVFIAHQSGEELLLAAEGNIPG